MSKAKTGSAVKVLTGMLTMALLTAAATGVGLFFRSIGFHETNVVIMYILSVLLTARFTQGYLYGILTSVVATLTFNFFFTEPYYTMSVNDPSYFVTFAVMTVTAIVTSALTSKEKQSALEALEKEAESGALYRLTNHLTEADSLQEIASTALRAIGDVFDCQAALLYIDENRKPDSGFWQLHRDRSITWRNADDTGAILRRIEALDAPFDVGEEFTDWPIHGREAVLGVVRVPREAGLSESQTWLLRSMIESTGLATDRYLSAQARIRSAEEATRERYRGNLLRAISHDLRTPLSGIMGTAEMLMGMTEADDPRHALAQDIYKESDWLYSLVQNILSLTRLRDGALPIAKQMEPVEEVIGGAVNRVMRLSGREIAVDAPDEVMFIPMDAGLIEQVLVNLLDNAVKHTPPEGEIQVVVRRDAENRRAVFSVLDRGAGIREEDLPHLFQMFYTTPSRQADASRGVGLGLTICEAIVRAHGGTIEARNRSDGPGAEFTFTLQTEETSDGKAQ